MKKPTPEEHIVQRARYWRMTEQAVIAAHPEHREAAKTAHQDAKRRLREALTYADRTAVPLIDTACQPNKPAL